MIIYKFHFNGTYNDFFIELNYLLMIPIVTACFGEHILRSKESSQGNFKRVEHSLQNSLFHLNIHTWDYFCKESRRLLL